MNKFKSDKDIRKEYNGMSIVDIHIESYEKNYHNRYEVVVELEFTVAEERVEYAPFNPIRKEFTLVLDQWLPDNTWVILLSVIESYLSSLMGEKYTYVDFGSYTPTYPLPM